VRSTPISWRKSSYSGNRGDCVEVADTLHHIHVRDTRNRPLGYLSFMPSDWTSLLGALREDEASQ
jgi:hypothetical protein